MSCTKGPNEAIRLLGSSRLHGRLRYLTNRWSSGVPAPGLFTRIRWLGLRLHDWTWETMRTRANVTGEYNGGGVSQQWDAVMMIPLWLKQTQLTFKFNEHMLGRTFTERLGWWQQSVAAQRKPLKQLKENQFWISSSKTSQSVVACESKWAGSGFAFVLNCIVEPWYKHTHVRWQMVDSLSYHTMFIRLSLD